MYTLNIDLWRLGESLNCGLSQNDSEIMYLQFSHIFEFVYPMLFFFLVIHYYFSTRCVSFRSLNTSSRLSEYTLLYMRLVSHLLSFLPDTFSLGIAIFIVISQHVFFATDFLPSVLWTSD